MKLRSAFAIVLASLLLSACGSPEKDATYETVNDLGDAYEKAVDVECSESGNNVHDHGWNQTGCGPTTILMIFTSDAKRDEIKGKNPLDTGRRWIQGGNWLVEADQFEAEAAHKVLGGELLD